MNLPSTLLDALRQFVSQTPLALWAVAIAVFTAAELVTRQRVPWHRRLVNLVNGSVVLVVIFFAGPLVAGTLHWLQGSLGYHPPFMVVLAPSHRWRRAESG